MVTEAELDRAAAILRHGGLVALPTETVYGLGANALDPEAVARIYQAKGRPETSPLIVHAATAEMARGLTREWPAGAGILAARYWPGPLTLVVPKHSSIPDIVTAGLDTVGIRIPAHPVILEVIRRAMLPIAAPSANRFTEISPTTAQHVREALGDAVDLILDGGPCEIGIESTVLSLAGPKPVLLRPGMISREELEAALDQPVLLAGKAEGAHPSPGMHERHYSPRTPVYIVSGGQLPAGRGVYLWWSAPAVAERNLSMPAEPAAYAQRLYQALHEADEAHLDWIAVEAPPGGREWAGISDRLRRAGSSRP